MKLLQSFLHIKRIQQRGFILLFTIVIISVTVGLSVSLLMSATRQSQLGSIQSETQTAFSAADAGVECGLGWVYPDPAPASFTCGGVVRADQNADPKKDIYYFDFLAMGPAINNGWASVDWDTNDRGGTSPACGVIVITHDATWGSPVQTGFMIEAFGYSICSPDGTGLMKPDTTNPNQVERKLIVRVPVITV